MNNTVLEVAIGLVFIYVLYSLLATTINEAIATLFDYRGKMLERGIEQMLDGQNIKLRWWDRLKNWTRLVREKKAAGAPADPAAGAFIAAAGGKMVTPRSSRFKRKSVLFARQITGHELYRRAAEGHLSAIPAYLPADTFTDILIDVLHPDKSGPVLLKNIEAHIGQLADDAQHPLSPELAGILRIYLQQANGDVQQFRTLIERWYDEMMDRVGGWYKRQANRILLVLGFLLAVIFNVNTIGIVDVLSKNADVRKAFVKSATDYVDRKLGEAKPAVTAARTAAMSGNGNTVPNGDSLTGSPAAATVIVAPDAAAAGQDTGLEAIRSRLSAIRTVYEEDIADANSVLGLGWGDYGFAHDSAAWVADPAAYQAAHRCGIFSDGRFSGEPPGVFGKIWFVLKSLFGFRAILGFLITAFAISLGAPFWFDLLNKFINLRITGAKPDDRKSGSASGSGAAANNRKPDPSAKG